MTTVVPIPVKPSTLWMRGVSRAATTLRRGVARNGGRTTGVLLDRRRVLVEDERATRVHGPTGSSALEAIMTAPAVDVSHLIRRWSAGEAPRR